MTTPRAPHGELRLSEASEALQDAVYVKDLDGRYLMVNAAAAAATGLERDQIIGKTDREVFPGDWRSVRDADREVIATGESQTIEEAVVVDGEMRTYLSTKAPLRDPAGEIIGLIGTSTDITARKASEEELRRREAKLAEAQAVAQVGSWEWDLVRDQASWSAELYRIFGVCPDEFEPSYDSFSAAVHPEDRDRVAAAVQRSVETGEDYEGEYRIVRPDGTTRSVLGRARVERDSDGTVVRLIGAAVDITDRKRSQEQLQAREALLNIAQELTETGSFEWDIATNRVSWSDGLYRIFGLEPGEFPSTFEGYLDRVHPEERLGRTRLIKAAIETGQPVDGEHRIVRADGEIRWVESRIRRIVGESGEAHRLVGVCQDITERKLQAEALEAEVRAAQEKALHDPLTGLANRTLAQDRLEHAYVLARRRENDLALLFIDIDGFKRVNDRFGHTAGDQLLRWVADRLKASVRGSDTVARIGGDEFLVICEEADGAIEAMDTAERVQAAFALPFDLEGDEQGVRLSIGISALSDRSLHSPTQLIDEADKAMYEAKSRGPGGVALHQPDE